MHTINLWGNNIGAQGAEELARLLQGTRVHPIDLTSNKISHQGVEGFARLLKGTNVHAINLGQNEIGFDVARRLKEQYPHIE